jgi:hypothetical protein
LAIPLDEVKGLAFKLMVHLSLLTHQGKYPTKATNLQIANAIGAGGSEKARSNRINELLNGRQYRKGRPDPVTGKHIRDGETVVRAGLADTGWIEITPKTKSSARVLNITDQWVKRGRFRVVSPPQPGEDLQSVPERISPAESPPQDSAEVLDATPATDQAAEVLDATPATDQAAEVPTISFRDDELKAAGFGRSFSRLETADQLGKLREVLYNNGLGLKDEGGETPSLTGAGLTGIDPMVRAAVEGVIKALAPHLIAKLRVTKASPASAKRTAPTALDRLVDQVRDQLEGNTDATLPGKMAEELSKPTGFADLKPEDFTGFYWEIFEGVRTGTGLSAGLVADTLKKAKTKKTPGNWFATVIGAERNKLRDKRKAGQ